MTHFAVIGFDHPPHSMKLRDSVRAEHRRYVLENDVRIMMTGAMTDSAGNQCGTIYVFDVAREQDVWDWLGNEPFYLAGVYDSMRVVAWTPALNRFDRIDWPAAALEAAARPD